MTSSSAKIRAKIKHYEKNTAGVGEALEGERLRSDETPSYKSGEQSAKKRDGKYASLSSSFSSSTRSCSSRAAEVDEHGRLHAVRVC